jgi:2,4-dienoyl-CoA reductase-like NADH-dependent reductase (Old Yellow Enzyme family)/thioredoxin reductase
MYAHLLQPGKIGSLYVRNRVIMAPLGSRLTTENGAVTDDMIEFYSQRARGGAGVIVIEAMGIEYPQAVGKPNHVRFHDERYVPGHAKLVEKIHECGGKAFAMLWHAGINKGCLEGVQPVGPSAILNPNTGIVPHELTVDEIHELVNKFGQAAARAKLCGYDGVNVHAAHGYLLSSFVSAATNQRTDEYGGSFENRIRFPLEVLAAIRRNTGKDYPVVFRINGSDFIDGGITPEEAAAFAEALEKGGVNAIDVSAGVYGSIDTMIEPIQYEEGWKLYLAENIRKHVSIPVFGVGVIHDPAKADKAIADGQVDFVCVGRELLCEPQWVNKAAAGETHFVKCIGCNSCFERIGKNLPIRCAVNALAGRELHTPRPAEKPLNIAVAGAGPAGITAAVTAAGRGHHVTLFEKENHIGGQLVLAGAPPRKDKILEYIGYLQEELNRSEVKVKLCHEFTVEDARSFDRVIVAAGAHCRTIPLKGSGFEYMTAWDALQNRSFSWDSRNVLLIGAGSVGCETALYIREHGAASVTVVEMREKIAADMDNISRMKLLHELAECGVRTLPSTVLDHMENGMAYLSGNVGEKIPCDTVVEAVGAAPDRELCDALYQNGIPFINIGDAACIGKIGEAVRGGFDAAATI